jgi:tRNA uridine 5-carboxymethylaminomethyl modification enzyme
MKLRFLCYLCPFFSGGMIFSYDIIVIGGGHAGCEAAAAAGNLGSKTLLITMDMNRIAQMSCNPAVGGIAKGQIVREIDALGGYMGIVTDRTAIQFRMLNRSKGAAMWSPRSQSDRHAYITEWRKILDTIPQVNIWQDTVSELIIENGTVCGVITQLQMVFKAKCVILTTGTFMSGLIHVGAVRFSGGRMAEAASYGVSEQLKSAGFKSDRMKTGTPVRIDGRSVDFSVMEEQCGENDFHKFSYLNFAPRQLPQRSCWITYTNGETHNILRSKLKDSPLYNGQILSIGPRYCPSIETKIIAFADKERHQLFLEPEGANTQEYYLNGFSSSMPIEVQLAALKTVPGFERVNIYRPGYAIEYDFFDPTQLTHTLETKLLKNLFFAGQVNGTTGYEEAAGQGLIAGINAHINCVGGEKFILKRDEAYIGVLIDDLVTKGVDEPYRMFTSRAEYRILLRQDNADARLTPKSFLLGLADRERYTRYSDKQTCVDRFIDFVRKEGVKPVEINAYLEIIGSTSIKQTTKIYDILRRPQVSLAKLAAVLPAVAERLDAISPSLQEETAEEIEIEIKYEGYISREKNVAEKLGRLEYLVIQDKFDYNTIQSLSTEARQKLQRINPVTIGQASRIPGISPNDISVLLILLGR